MFLLQFPWTSRQEELLVMVMLLIWLIIITPPWSHLLSELSLISSYDTSESETSVSKNATAIKSLLTVKILCWTVSCYFQSNSQTVSQVLDPPYLELDWQNITPTKNRKWNTKHGLVIVDRISFWYVEELLIDRRKKYR